MMYEICIMSGRRVKVLATACGLSEAVGLRAKTSGSFLRFVRV